MLFSKIKRCHDDRVIKAGLDVVADFRHVGIKVERFACCFKKDTLIFAFGYDNDIPYSENIQTAMAEQFARKMPREERYKKIAYYSSEKFDAECSKHCEGLWTVIS